MVIRRSGRRRIPPRVSVCIPTYNRARYLAQAIDSVLGQTFEAYELIVADDASTDDTAEVVRAYGDPRIRYLRNDRNLGGPANWVRAFGAATATYCAILGDDDRWAPAFLESLVTPLDEQSAVDVTFSDHWVIDAEGDTLPGLTERYSQAYGRAGLRPGLHQPFVELAVLSQSLAVSAALLRRDRVRQLCALDSRAGLALDYYLFAVLALAGGAAWYVPDRLASSRFHDGSLSATRQLQVARDMQWICGDLIQRAPRGRIRGQIRARWSRAASVESYELLRVRRRGRALRSLVRSVRLSPWRWRTWLRVPGALILAIKPDLRPTGSRLGRVQTDVPRRAG